MLATVPTAPEGTQHSIYSSLAAEFLSVELKLNFLRPAQESTIRGIAKARKIGRTTAACELEAEIKRAQK